MRPSPESLSVLPLLIGVALSPSTVDAAAFRHAGQPAGLIDNANGDNIYRDAHGSALPGLTWLRESVAEIIFGRPSTKHSDSTSPSVPLSRYRDDVVVRFNVTNSADQVALAQAVKEKRLDVWASTPQFVDIRLQENQLRPLLNLIPSSLQTQWSILIPDLEEAVRATYPTKGETGEFEDAAENLDAACNIFFHDYQPLSVITSWMSLMETMFPSIAEMSSIGDSYEGRPIHAFRIGNHSGDNADNSTRKTILVTGGLHGREWISTSTVTYLLWSIITAYGKEAMVTKLLKHFDIIFIPVLNPDGYDYTWKTDRLWRKSRQQTKVSMCRGFDLDQAFGFVWDQTKSQVDPCSESYGGDEPFQAVEATRLADWGRNQTEKGVRFVGFLDLHSYSQQILFPYTFTCDEDPPNRENLEELGVGLAKAIRLSSGNFYTVSSACDVARQDGASEATGGSAIDWFYHEFHSRYSYQVKLRDTGSYGFLLPRSQIIPTGEEMLNALKYFGDFLLGNNGIESISKSEDRTKGRVELK
ncbi:putative metallocarboxypeptidase ecm14 [Neurospora sp. IMI 360204]|nr:putative metallocarboxypeptidase ecm14 [Neurospora sp. IMI 360204]